MRHSIFWKLVLIILPIVLLVNITILGVSYKITYDQNIEHCKSEAKEAAQLAAKYFEMYDPYDIEASSRCNDSFTELCGILNISYISALRPNLEEDSLTYLAIGFGKDATENARKSRYAGVKVSGIYSAELKAFINGEEVFRIEKNNLDSTMVCFAPVKQYYDWDNLRFVSDKTASIVCAEIQIDNITDTFTSKFTTIVLLVALSTIPMFIVIAAFFRRKVSVPASVISKRMARFVEDQEKDFVPLAIKGQDEFARMAQSFNSMASDIDRYVENISELNKQKSTQEAELNIARTIQMGLLAQPRFRNETASVNAVTIPAKDVGGDLYDYQVLPDGKISIAVADVAGKGISASLFMSRAITLLHQFAESGLSPSETLYQYNNHLAAHNPNTMFITTFVGIYDPMTGEFTYSNAGHNNPYLLSDRLIELDQAHGMAAGIFKDVDYEVCTVRMKPGDTLFLYTDGITEAKNPENKLFGDDALREFLSEHLGEQGRPIMLQLRTRLIDFVKDAPQNDDITVLTLTVFDKHSQHLYLSTKKENLSVINECIGALDIPADLRAQLRIMAEEMFVNICSYAYEFENGESEVIIVAQEDKVTLTFIDNGKPFDPTADILDIEEYDIDNTIGGLGRFLTFEIADDYSYEYKDGKNILTIIKNIPPSED